MNPRKGFISARNDSMTSRLFSIADSAVIRYLHPVNSGQCARLSGCPKAKAWLDNGTCV